MNPFQYNPDKLPDSHFEGGLLDHLVVGNEGRLLDYRRTPVRLSELREASGLAVLQILDFEDEGNTWEIPFEEICSFQFALGSRRADPKAATRYAAIAGRLNRRTTIACEQGARRPTFAELAEAEREADEWLRLQSAAMRTRVRPNFSRRMGLKPLFANLKAYMEEHGLADIEANIAAHYPRKFHYSESVKAHCIVIAEMGLVPYEGKVLRDEGVLQGGFDRARRREHVIRRLAFVRALYTSLGVSSLLLYRGVHSHGLPEPPRNETFVSATTDLRIAEALACFLEPSNPNKEGYSVGVLMSGRVPGSGVIRGRGSGERETTASSLAGKEESSRKEDNSGQGKDGPAGAIAQGGNGR